VGVPLFTSGAEPVFQKTKRMLVFLSKHAKKRHFFKQNSYPQRIILSSVTKNRSTGADEAPTAL
jgi:hypothetical protein